MKFSKQCFEYFLKFIQSTDVGNSAYNSPWYKGSIAYKKSLAFIIQRSQKEPNLTAYKFFIASPEMFTKIMTTSWRLLAVLNTMYSGL